MISSKPDKGIEAMKASFTRFTYRDSIDSSPSKALASMKLILLWLRSLKKQQHRNNKFVNNGVSLSETYYMIQKAINMFTHTLLEKKGSNWVI